jgi:tetratricopeptide (TPR) repeat protein
MSSWNQLDRRQRFARQILPQGIAGFLLIISIATTPSSAQANQPTADLDILIVARTARDQNRYAEAVKAYQQVIHTNADPTIIATAQTELAWIYAYQKNYSASLALCDRLVQRDPTSAVFQLQRAEILSWAKQYDDSIRAYQNILTQNPQFLPAQLGQAEVWSWSGRYDQAIRAYRAVLSRQADNEKALTGIAQITLWQGDLTKALQQFLPLRQQFPQSIPIQLGLAKTYQARQELRLALATIQSLVEAKNPQAMAISQEIRAIQSYSEVTIRSRSSDRNSWAINQSAKLRLGDTDTLQSVQVGYGKFTEPGRKPLQTTPIRVGIEGTNYPTRWQLKAGVDIFDRLAAQPVVEGQITTQFSPTVRVGATGNYQVYQENVTTLENGIKVLRIQPHLHWQIDPSRSLYAQYGTGFYSDGNRDGQLWVGLKQQLGDFYVEGSILNWEYAKDPNNGYFAPSDYFLYSGELGWQGKVAELATCQLAVSIGRQSYSGESRSASGYKGGCKLELSPTTTIDSQYRYSSNAVLTGATGNANEQSFQISLKTNF